MLGPGLALTIDRREDIDDASVELLELLGKRAEKSLLLFCPLGELAFLLVGLGQTIGKPDVDSTAHDGRPSDSRRPTASEISATDAQRKYCSKDAPLFTS